MALSALPAAARSFSALASSQSLFMDQVIRISPKESGMSRTIIILIIGRNASPIPYEAYQCTWHNQHIQKLRKKILGKGHVCLTVLYFLLCFQAIIHPDTGKKVLMPFRMSGLFVKKIDQFDIVTLSSVHFYGKKNYDKRFSHLCFCRICTFWNSNGKFKCLNLLVEFKYLKQSVLVFHFWHQYNCHFKQGDKGNPYSFYSHPFYYEGNLIPHSDIEYCIVCFLLLISQFHMSNQEFFRSEN